MPVPFDLATAPLTGCNLVEASAGTGKTYSLAGLFLRLVVEDGLGVDEILVVTFTEAATQELRGRIRERLREALAGFRTGDAGGDPLLAHLLARPEGTRDRAPARLTAALRCFDEAAISTIHGFCQRILAERAFECGVPLAAELVPDPSALVEEVVADHWRNRLHRASAGFARYVVGLGTGLDDLVEFARTWTGRSQQVVVPSIVAEDLGPVEAEVRQRFEAVARPWPAVRGEVLDILVGDPALGHRSLSKRTVPRLGTDMDRFVAGTDPLALFEGLVRFGTVFLESQTKAGRDTPCHPFFHSCQALVDARQALVETYERAWIAFRADLLAHLERELPRRKALQGVRTFDDLLTGVHGALAGPGGERLAEALRARFRAALIDEFQDTDPLQYEIFHRVFGGAPEPRLFLIGDPKQAIYSFRGADLFAYLGAARSADRRFTLESNWRSTPDLLRAVEHLFTRGGNPFVFDEIGFVPVSAGGGGQGPLVVAGAANPEPLQVWWVPPGSDGKLPAKNKVTPALLEAVAAETLRLLVEGGEGWATLDGRPLEPGDVAVLVRTNEQARGVQEALARRRIPSVIASAESLFTAPEAVEMLRLVAALAEPSHEGRVRAALATELVGVKGGELHRLGDDERAWDRWLERFARYHELWILRGFVAAARTVLSELRVRERLLAHPDGERRLTNVLHLVEVLQGAAEAGRLGPEALVGWLGRRIVDRDGADEYQLRLETDDRAVQVVTVHKSKGLEYPVVLCPFLWEGLRDPDDDEPVVCHDPADPSHLVLDLGGPDRDLHRALARWEELAERVRLIYVALTRARQRCYLAWGAVNKGEDAALGYLLHAPETVRSAAPETLVADLVANAGDAPERYEADLTHLAGASGGALAVGPLPEAPPGVYAPDIRDETPLGRRPPPVRIPRDWGVSSYSGLVSGHPERVEHPDRDEGTAPPVSAAEPGPVEGGDIFAFPRGARAGTCLHAILEDLDFPAADRETLEAHVAEKLRVHGFDPGWIPAVAANLATVLDAPLLGDGSGFRLGALCRADRLTELEFHLPLGRITPAGLARCLTDGPDLPPGLGERVGRLGFRPLRGILKGFVDLVFRHDGRVYLLDWKSNHLGNRPEDYGTDALTDAMADHHYDLQALLYVVALHRYLQWRQPGYRYDDHVGGTVYVFLRGVDGTRTHGLHRFRPGRDRVEALARYLGEGEGRHG